MFTKELKESVRSLNGNATFLRLKRYLDEELDTTTKALASAKEIEIIYRLQGKVQWLTQLLNDINHSEQNRID